MCRDECRFDFDKAFCHLAFDLGAWSRQPAVVNVSEFFDSGLEAIRSIGDSMGGH